MNAADPLSRPSAARRLLRRTRADGIGWIVRAAWDRAFPPRVALLPPVITAVRGGRGLEIGGPSPIFGRRGPLAVYPHIGALDGVNFETRTPWEHDLRDGGPFRFDRSRPAGTQWIREAAALHGITDGAYDFVLSSHCLEHLANPLGALREWRRVTRPAGHLLLVVPDPLRSFDHRRPITALEHLRQDAAESRGEDDATHFAEVLALHDIGQDTGLGSAEELRTRVARNHELRCVHHHVFDLALAARALAETGWQVLATERVRPVHLIAFARKGPA